MYHYTQLSNKELGELQEIADKMGLKGVKSLERQDLIYRILDEQAIAGAQKKVAAEECLKTKSRSKTWLQMLKASLFMQTETMLFAEDLLK